MVTRSQVEAHRRDLNELVRLSERDLRVVVRQAGDDAEQVRDALMDTVPQLVTVYGLAAAALAADWYDEVRERAAVRGRFRAMPAELPERGRTDALARWAAGPMFSAEPDRALVFAKASGGLQRIVANADRDTVTLSAGRDPQARGWVREGTGRCDWCAARIGVLTTDPYEAFATHDKCRCVAAPAF
jgi:hypothetical protein